MRKKSAASMIVGRTPADALQRAVVRYVEAKGGAVLVIGGVEIRQWPGENFNFTVSVKCTEQKPVRKPERNEKPEVPHVSV